MSDNTLNLKLKCIKCKSLIDVHQRKDYIYKVKCTTDENKDIWITYIDCPECRHRHYVQIDDTETNRIKNDCLSVMSSILKKSVNGKEIPQQQQQKYKKLNKRLNELRSELVLKLVGKELTDSDGNKFTIDEFTIVK